MQHLEVSAAVRHIYMSLGFKRLIETTPVGHDSSVGIATAYGLDGPGIESRWGEIFRTCADRT